MIMKKSVVVSEDCGESGGQVFGLGPILKSAIKVSMAEFAEFGEYGFAEYERTLKGILNKKVDFGTQRAASQFLDAIEEAATLTRRNLRIA